MKPAPPVNRIRPTFAIMLACVVAISLIPVWLLTRPEPGAKTLSADTGLGAAAHRFRARWQRITAAPRGAAVSVRATTQAPPRIPKPGNATTTLEERWGIRVCSARLTMGNTFLDLRYEVVDPAKVSQLANANVRAYLWDRASGARLFLTAPPREGGFPPTENRIAVGRTYFAMVSNKGGVLKSGKSVGLVVGDSLTTNVTID